VAAIARDAGVPEKGPPLDGSDLPADQAQLARAVLGTSLSAASRRRARRPSSRRSARRAGTSR
jgi:hypothetical protein